MLNTAIQTEHIHLQSINQRNSNWMCVTWHQLSIKIRQRGECHAQFILGQHQHLSIQPDKIPGTVNLTISIMSEQASQYEQHVHKHLRIDRSMISALIYRTKWNYQCIKNKLFTNVHCWMGVINNSASETTTTELRTFISIGVIQNAINVDGIRLQTMLQPTTITRVNI